VTLEKQLEADIELCQRYTLRPRLSRCRDAHGGDDYVNSEMHFKAAIERVWGCACRRL
jgi:hypothetical protein